MKTTPNAETKISECAVRVRQRVFIPLRQVQQKVEFVSFHGLLQGNQPIALIFGALSPQGPTPVRIHSECLTGDVFGSLRCDCGPQLHEVIEEMNMTGGILLYLRQEGRGIGLYAKLDAYHLQDGGLDTFAANRELGFSDDLRTYDDAANMLRALDTTEIILISNNPDKANQLQQLGIQVVAVQNTAAHVNAHNYRYLAAKQEQHRHALHLEPAKSIDQASSTSPSGRPFSFH
jgi:GTP cyclohydrolase II